MANKASAKKRNHMLVNGLIALVLVGSGIWLFMIFFGASKTHYTNDAQVEEYINPINTRIPGYIKEVRFKEHQEVKKGDTLVIIDDREYRIHLEQAEAAWLSARAARQAGGSAVRTVESNVEVSEAQIAASEARLSNAARNLARYENLLGEGAATQQQYDQVKADHDALAAQTLALQRQRGTASLSAMEASSRLGINDAEIKRTHAAYAMAALNLSYTVITAPYDGVTGRRTIQEGQLIQPGQTLVSLVRSDEKWVVANYRETEIGGLHLGQRMEILADGVDGETYLGTITAISQATGSRYSAVPVDNATGNFVKVQQRIPVRIDFVDDGDNARRLGLLRAGMNVEVKISDH